MIDFIVTTWAVMAVVVAVVFLAALKNTDLSFDKDMFFALIVNMVIAPFSLTVIIFDYCYFEKFE